MLYSGISEPWVALTVLPITVLDKHAETYIHVDKAESDFITDLSGR